MTYLTKNGIKHSAREYIQNRNYLYQASTCTICGNVLKNPSWKVCQSCYVFLKHQMSEYKKENKH